MAKEEADKAKKKEAEKGGKAHPKAHARKRAHKKTHGHKPFLDGADATCGQC